MRTGLRFSGSSGKQQALDASLLSKRLALLLRNFQLSLTRSPCLRFQRRIP